MTIEDPNSQIEQSIGEESKGSDKPIEIEISVEAQAIINRELVELAMKEGVDEEIVEMRRVELEAQYRVLTWARETLTPQNFTYPGAGPNTPLPASVFPDAVFRSSSETDPKNIVAYLQQSGDQSLDLVFLNEGSATNFDIRREVARTVKIDGAIITYRTIQTEEEDENLEEDPVLPLFPGFEQIAIPEELQGRSDLINVDCYLLKKISEEGFDIPTNIDERPGLPSPDVRHPWVERPMPAELPPIETLFSERFFQRTAQEKIQFIRELLSQEGLRKLTRARTEDMLAYMADQTKFEKGDHSRLNGLLQAEGSPLDADTIWRQLGEDRRREVLNEIGQLLDTDIVGTYEAIQAVLENNPPETKTTVSLITNNPLYHFEIVIDRKVLQYQFMKVMDTPSS